MTRKDVHSQVYALIGKHWVHRTRQGLCRIGVGKEAVAEGSSWEAALLALASLNLPWVPNHPEDSRSEPAEVA